MAIRKKTEKERVDVYKLREDLMKLAENEAKKKPSISKEELKKKLSDYVTKSPVGEAALSPGMKNLVETVIGICAEFAIKSVEIYLREKKEWEKTQEAKGKPAASPAAKKPAKPAGKKSILKKKSSVKKK